MLTTENWTYCHYTNEALKLLVSIGGEEKNGTFQDMYFLSIMEGDNDTLSQWEFADLESTLEYANRNFAHWKFLDFFAEEKSSGGCSTCQAH